MKLNLSASVRAKLSDKHDGVTEDEICQCFANRCGPILIDSRARNLTNPVTRWFVAETDRGRILKIAYMPMPGGEIVIKTAYKPNEIELGIYNGRNT